MADANICAERSGFLFAHDCDRPVAGACDDCGKVVCRDHQRHVVKGQTRGVRMPKGPLPPNQRVICVSCDLAARKKSSATDSD